MPGYLSRPNCPKLSQNLIAGKFFISKTSITDFRFGLSDDYERQIIVEDLDKPRLIKAWINLKKDDRFFDPIKAISCGIDYHHIKINGGQKYKPPPNTIRQFNKICKDSGDGIVAISSTYEHNAAGYLICSYLAKIKGWQIDDAIKEYNEKNSPGITRTHLLRDLVAKF